MSHHTAPLKDAPVDQSQEGGLQSSSQRYHPPPLLPRRESFHCTSDRPHPPPFRTAVSSIGPMTTSNLILGTPTEEKASPKFSSKRGKERKLDKEELTTKGRKRKRLAKACSACHKNKRRCDGFAPCSNCEFSNRPCQYLNAQGEPIPPPRTRDPSNTLSKGKDDDKATSADGSDVAGHEGRRASGESNQSIRDGQIDPESEMNRKPSIGPLQVVDMDVSLGAELVDIFFKRCLPLPFMLHAPTFNYRLYLNQVSPILLDSMYAFAARLCENPFFLQTFPPNHPAHLRGELFALRAHRSAEIMIQQRNAWSEETRRADRGSWQETELAQAAYLLSVYFTCLREPKLGLFYLDAGVDILRPSSAAYIQPPATPTGASPIEYSTHMECRTRTFWAFVLHDLCAASNGRPRKLEEVDLGTIPLPGTEAHWARWGGGGIGGREPGRRDGLVAGTGNWLGEDGSVGEIGSVIRILSILADIMSLATDPNAGDSKQTLAARLEAALKAWAMALPSHMHFNEPNLTTAVSKLSSSVAEIKASGWMYAYMHAVAECGMFYLQAAMAPVSDGMFTARRQSQAIENLIVIMNAINQTGREGFSFLFPLLVISNWQEHLEKSDLLVKDVKHHLTEERLNHWWSEMSREWGVERHDVLRRGFYILPVSPVVSQQKYRYSHFSHSDRPFLATSSLGLYQASPPDRITLEPAAAISPTSTATISVTTPNFSRTSRFNLPTLPPLRPRAASGASVLSSYYGRSPSPPHHLPSVTSALSDRGSDKEHEPISLPSISSELRYREPSSPRHPLSQSISFRYVPKQHPYVREKPRSPRRSISEKDMREGGHITGIAALVTAAEREREREKEARGQNVRP
ncbi:hypothetical protein IAS59_003873 [Cryptococcus gattii]